MLILEEGLVTSIRINSFPSKHFSQYCFVINLFSIVPVYVDTLGVNELDYTPAPLTMIHSKEHGMVVVFLHNHKTDFLLNQYDMFPYV